MVFLKLIMYAEGPCRHCCGENYPKTKQLNPHPFKKGFRTKIGVSAGADSCLSLLCFNLSKTLLNAMAVDRYRDMYQCVEHLKLEYPAFVAQGQATDGSGWVFELLEQKLSGQPIRAYFLAKAARWLIQLQSPWQRARTHILPGQQRFFFAQLPLAFEVVITIQYLHNQILDGKSGVTDRESISRNLLAANLLKDQLYRYLEQEVPAWARTATVKAIRSCFEQVDQGQFLEQTQNTYAGFRSGQPEWKKTLPSGLLERADLSAVAPFLEKLKTDLPVMLHEQLEVYFHRIYLTCASLFVEAVQLLGKLLRVSNKRLEAVRQFSVCYGLMRQLVNDNADWIPSRYGLETKTKTAADSFSDLKNTTLTLPLLFFLATGQGGKIHYFLERQMRWSPAFEESVFDEILDSDALFKSIQNTRILAELALAYLPLSELNARFLADSCEIVHWNKFLAPCLQHQAYRGYRKTAYRKRTRNLIMELRRERTQQVEHQTGTRKEWQHGLEPSFPVVIPKLHALLRQTS